MRRLFQFRLAVAFAAVLGLLGQARSLAAQTYPNRTITIIVPFGAGGPADIYARYVGNFLAEEFKQTVLVDNRPGAGAIIGTALAAKAAPDGYTLLLMSNTHTTNETLIAKKPFELLRDFEPVAPINASDLVMVINPKVPANDLKEFVALLKAKPNDLNYASSGTGTPYHMAGELFKSMSATGMVHVPHRGSGDARFSVISGNVQMMLDAVTTMAPSVKEGQVRALGTTGAKRSAVLPDVPTLAEAGLPGYEATIWLGLMAPKSTPPAIIDRLNQAVNKYLALPSTKSAWAIQGADPLIMKPAEFDAYIRADVRKWADLIEAAGIPIQ